MLFSPGKPSPRGIPSLPDICLQTLSYRLALVWHRNSLHHWMALLWFHKDQRWQNTPGSFVLTSECVAVAKTGVYCSWPRERSVTSSEFLITRASAGFLCSEVESWNLTYMEKGKSRVRLLNTCGLVTVRWDIVFKSSYSVLVNVDGIIFKWQMTWLHQLLL